MGRILIASRGRTKIDTCSCADQARGRRRPSARRLLAGLARPPEEAARLLLGTVLVRRVPRAASAPRASWRRRPTSATDDPAAHAFRGRTARTAPLWGPPGTVYVYFIYGMHHCLNFAVEREGTAGCVLIRAAEPLAGLAPGAATGPGRLCRALAIDTAPERPAPLRGDGARSTCAKGRPPLRIGVSTRVGIRQAADRPLRFFDADSPAVSPHRGGRRPRRCPAGGRLGESHEARRFRGPGYARRRQRAGLATTAWAPSSARGWPETSTACPFSIKILLESLLRNLDGELVTEPRRAPPGRLERGAARGRRAALHARRA